MDPSVVLILTWVVAGLVVGLYIWFVVWRYRVDRRKKAAALQEDDALTRALDRLTVTPPPTEDQVITPVVAAPPPTRETSTSAPSPEPMATPASSPASTPAPPDAATVASTLSGIRLPNGLVPLTTMASRTNTGDRVAFWTNEAPVEVVGPAFSDELERLGFTVIPLDGRSLSAQRDGARLLVVVHPDGPIATIGDQPAFTSVPEHSVVIEVWIPE
jgi:hypothetical protein